MTPKQRNNFLLDFEELENISIDLVPNFTQFLNKLREINECKNRLKISDDDFVNAFSDETKYLNAKKAILLINDYIEFEKSLE